MKKKIKSKKTYNIKKAATQRIKITLTKITF